MRGKADTKTMQHLNHVDLLSKIYQAGGSFRQFRDSETIAQKHLANRAEAEEKGEGNANVAGATNGDNEGTPITNLETTPFPDGGRCSRSLDKLKVGDALELRGPKGHIEYLGSGNFGFTKRTRGSSIVNVIHQKFSHVLRVGCFVNCFWGADVRPNTGIISYASILVLQLDISSHAEIFRPLHHNLAPRT